jgi:hypothetical protein
MHNHLWVPYTVGILVDFADSQVGFGMHYIHTVQFGGALDCSGSRIPSEGPSHPLMTSLSSHLAN